MLPYFGKQMAITCAYRSAAKMKAKKPDIGTIPVSGLMPHYRGRHTKALRAIYPTHLGNPWAYQVGRLGGE